MSAGRGRSALLVLLLWWGAVVLGVMALGASWRVAIVRTLMGFAAMFLAALGLKLADIFGYGASALEEEEAPIHYKVYEAGEPLFSGAIVEIREDGKVYRKRWPLE